MQYLITFLEGLISFVSPCMLPMLPIYVSYFAGASDNKRRPVLMALCFVLGFTFVFSVLGLFAGSVGFLFNEYQSWVNIVCGIIIIFFGFNFLGVINLPTFHSTHKRMKVSGAFSAFVFGVVFSISHAPCVGVWLGSALTTAAASGGIYSGILLLVSYSVGMGIPFVVASVIIDKLKGIFNSIENNYNLINSICGFFLVLVGICMMLGWLSGIVELFEEVLHHTHAHTH